MRWIPCSARFALVGTHARGTGALQVYALNHGKMETLLDIEKQHGFKCCTFAASSLEQRHLASGDYDGRLAVGCSLRRLRFIFSHPLFRNKPLNARAQVWNLEHTDLPIYSVKAHAGLINCIDGCGGLGIGYGAPEIVTGGRDGSVKVTACFSPSVLGCEA